MRERRLIRYERKFDGTASTHGYVMSVGPKFFLIAHVTSRIRFDGFECVRINDIRSPRPDPYAKFAEAALRKRHKHRPRKPRIDLSDIKTLLLSAARSFPLVTVHREHADPDVCHIGSDIGVKDGRVSMLEIGPDAVWDDAPSFYKADEITRVDFGGDYEDALHVVGGRPKKEMK